MLSQLLDMKSVCVCVLLETQRSSSHPLRCICSESRSFQHCFQRTEQSCLEKVTQIQRLFLRRWFLFIHMNLPDEGKTFQKILFTVMSQGRDQISWRAINSLIRVPALLSKSNNTPYLIYKCIYLWPLKINITVHHLIAENM